MRYAKENQSLKASHSFSLGVVVLVLISMFAFAEILHAVSPSNYDMIVHQHSAEREVYTTAMAATGISSVITITSRSGVAPFVANWAINIIRLLLPLELLAKSLKYTPFVVYQLVITICIVRTLFRTQGEETAAIVLALLLAFVVASASFEPDFGSWIRHETATLPFLVELIGLSSFGTKEMRS